MSENSPEFERFRLNIVPGSGLDSDAANDFSGTQFKLELELDDIAAIPEYEEHYKRYDEKLASIGKPPISHDILASSNQDSIKKYNRFVKGFNNALKKGLNRDVLLKICQNAQQFVHKPSQTKK